MFDGFPEQALIFYEGLAADNSKAYWTDHKAVYDNCVRAPMEALLLALEPEFGAAKLFRPYNDVRFHKGKPLYKTQVAAAVHDDRSGKGTRYLALSADGLSLAGGYYQTTTDQVERLRAAVDDHRSGRALQRVLEALTGNGWDVGEPELTRVPPAFRPEDGSEHPRADLLRRKTLTAGRSYEPEPWLHTPQVLERVRADWHELDGLSAWLERNVGATREVRQ